MRKTVGMEASMLRSFVSLVVVVAVASAVGARAQSVVIRVSVTGESNLRTEFVESLKDAGKEAAVSFEVVPKSDPRRDYVLLIAQETSLGGAAAAVIALDGDGEVAASVVRSGRLSGRGAMNASAKEIAKKMAVLRR